MSARKEVTGGVPVTIISWLLIALVCSCISCKGDSIDRKKGPASIRNTGGEFKNKGADEYRCASAILVLPENPKPGEPFRVLAAGEEKILKAQIIVKGPGGGIESLATKRGNELPYWRIDDFSGSPAGNYSVSLIVDKKEAGALEFTISPVKSNPQTGVVWKSIRGWDCGMEALYSAWINALFQDCDERSSWPALHKVTEDKNHNFLYNYLSLDEDDPGGKSSLVMQPDCADNPFFLRAYFAWKLGLPFGYHLCDRGSLVKNPRPGQWITNETATRAGKPVEAFSGFLRKLKDGVHSGTARTALDNENSDYYPVPLEQGALRPGVVFADPYGHTLILTGRIPQRGEHPGMLLAVDAQPDGTVGIKRFWKGNFLFNTAGVIGEPGFRAFRPISLTKGVLHLMQNKELTAAEGFVPYSTEQRKMESSVFYHTMERLINPDPLEPESALLDLIQALHEQLLVRVTSVANGEAWFKSHPGTVIPMPASAAGIFQAGGQWEDFSTPNRDLRLLIAMDAVLDFPGLVARAPGDYKITASSSPEQIKKKLQAILDEKVSGLSISYTRSDGSVQKLTLGELLKREDAFEMAYNPNDGIEIRWGAPENSDERASCHRRAPPVQLERMLSVRPWFAKRLHPPT
jgi:hypothetical protein